ncbi:MAG: DUF6090 family protein [Flavobacteriaceae bacterium]|nr:DUF6090 family protein [Flavobacteriaceae bacterium]
MPKLFRKIRQNLLNEGLSIGEAGKTSRYFKYAIGEICALVVIGILIALQINNWNETRKIKRSEQEILQNLKNELLVNKDKLEKIYANQLEVFKSSDSLLKLFNTDVSNISIIKLDSLFANFEVALTFEASDGYIKSLLASGKVDYIQNSNLKAFVGLFDGQVIDATEENYAVRRLFEERLWPVIDGKINSSNRVRTLTNYAKIPKGSYTSDYIWFFSNREIEDIVSNITVWRIDLMTDEQTFLNNIKHTIATIDKELQQ